MEYDFYTKMIVKREFAIKEIEFLKSEKAKLAMGNLANGIVLAYFNKMKRELDVVIDGEFS